MSSSIAGPENVDWFLDIGASAHMTTNPSILDQLKNYTGMNSMIVENDASLPILHTDTDMNQETSIIQYTSMKMCKKYC